VSAIFVLQYYYNMTTQEFMYWDGAAKTYVPVSNTETAAPESTDTQKSAEVPKEKEEKKNKAKNIAKVTLLMLYYVIVDVIVDFGKIITWA